MLYLLGICVAFMCLIFVMFYIFYRCNIKSKKKIIPKNVYDTYNEYILEKCKATYLKQTNIIEKIPVNINEITYYSSSSDDSSSSSDD